MSDGFRRTWDKKLYEEKAQERLDNGGELLESSSSSDIKRPKVLKEEFMPASSNADGPMGSQRAYLQARANKIDVDSKAGKVEMVDPNNLEKGAGYYCEVCACLLKDSASYLAHINGKKHQRALGFSMRVERASIDKVKEHMENLKKSIVEKTNYIKPSSIEAHESRVALSVAEEEERKKKRKLDKIKKDKVIDESEFDTVDPEMASLLGFGGFGGGSKSK